MARPDLWRPSVRVLEPYDIVLAQISARLHLDKVERYQSRVFDPVGDTDRDVRRLVLAKEHGFVPTGDAGGAVDHDPVLSPVVVHLQGKLFARFHGYLLDLKSLAGLKGGRSELVKLAKRLIVEEALEAEGRDALGRECYEHGAAPGQGYRNGNRRGRLKTSEGFIEYLVPQVSGREEPF